MRRYLWQLFPPEEGAAGAEEGPPRPPIPEEYRARSGKLEMLVRELSKEPQVGVDESVASVESAESVEVPPFVSVAKIAHTRFLPDFRDLHLAREQGASGIVEERAKPQPPGYVL